MEALLENCNLEAIYTTFGNEKVIKAHAQFPDRSSEDRDRKSQKPYAEFPDRLEDRDRKSQKTYAEFPDRLERS